MVKYLTDKCNARQPAVSVGEGKTTPRESGNIKTPFVETTEGCKKSQKTGWEGRNDSDGDTGGRHGPSVQGRRRGEEDVR